jgi:methionine-S-sulfoxide reductase
MPQQTAIFAGGCFWCTEAAFEQLAGVSDVTSGYIGGPAETANYRAVCEGDTGHAEAIRITYDPAKITYDQLLDVFFDAHDPTQLNRQGNDIGTQYRSAIFYANEDEKRIAADKIRALNASKHFAHRHHARAAHRVLSRRGLSPGLRPAESRPAVHPVGFDAQGLQDPRQTRRPDPQVAAPLVQATRPVRKQFSIITTKNR